MLGNGVSFVHQYRFAAVELLPSNRSQIAISRILVGGIVGGFLGPYLANISVNWLAAEFAGCFLVLAILHLLAACVLLTYKQPVIQKRYLTQKPQRSLIEIINNLYVLWQYPFGYSFITFENIFEKKSSATTKRKIPWLHLLQDITAE